MPTFRSGKSIHPAGKPWYARVRVNYESYDLGYFSSREEAEWHEQEFRITMTGKPLNAPDWDSNKVQPWQMTKEG